MYADSCEGVWNEAIVHPAGGGRRTREPGQVREEAAVEVFLSGRRQLYSLGDIELMSEYRVLARKYRPATFADLVGQEVLVRTLSNAITSGRIAHAFLLTGIRGIGKTTTARIIARALNCIGEDGQGQPTVEPCGVCPNCVQIREDRHPDVIEMDAASRTGVEAMRELIETVHYRPTQARYKVYIIDEVHMLSTSAFNALLKTLEEPPSQIIFIFATTEIHKIPVTILSRCQRFDLKRLDIARLTEHLQTICEREQVGAEEEGLRLIATAAEGSVRDALSLLDRAIAHHTAADGSPVPSSLVREMLGLSDRTRLFALLEALLAGNIAQALALLEAQYHDGADMSLLFATLLQLVHTVSRIAVTPGADAGPAYGEAERRLAKELAEKADIPALTMAWQMLLKGQDEMRRAPDALAAAEMLCIRLAHAANLPSPAEVIAAMRQGEQPVIPNPSRTRGGAPATRGGGAAHAYAPASEPELFAEPEIEMETARLSLAASNPPISIASFEALAEWLEQVREPMLYHHLFTHARLIAFEQGRVVIARHAALPPDFCSRLSSLLSRATAKDWQVSYGEGEGAPTLSEERQRAREAAIAVASAHPDVRAVLDTFPGAEVTQVINHPQVR